MNNEQDISREELKQWINKNAFGIADVFNKFVGIGFHPFLYIKTVNGQTAIMKYVKDGNDQLLGTVNIPPDALRYTAVKDYLTAKIKAKNDWWSPQVVQGRKFLQRQTRPYPIKPQEYDTLFYVIQDTTMKDLVRYPGSQALRTFQTLPEANAAREIKVKETGRYHTVIRVVEHKTNIYNELTISDNLVAENGWYYPQRHKNPAAA